MDELLEQIDRWAHWIATGTVLEVRAGAVVIQLDGAIGDVEAAADPDRVISATPMPTSDARLAPGAHVLVEHVRDCFFLHGTVPAAVVLPVSYGSEPA